MCYINKRKIITFKLEKFKITIEFQLSKLAGIKDSLDAIIDFHIREGESLLQLLASFLTYF